MKVAVHFSNLICIKFAAQKSFTSLWKKSPLAHDDDPDLKLKWWDTYGVHPNWIIPNSPDPSVGNSVGWIRLSK